MAKKFGCPNCGHKVVRAELPKATMTYHHAENGAVLEYHFHGGYVTGKAWCDKCQTPCNNPIIEWTKEE